jgi:hypothetical protein
VHIPTTIATEGAHLSELVQHHVRLKPRTIRVRGFEIYDAKSITGLTNCIDCVEEIGLLATRTDFQGDLFYSRRPVKMGTMHKGLRKYSPMLPLVVCLESSITAL